jgi:hypothetical protein
MTDNRAAAKRIVLDLLVTWGATARPGMSELFEVLGSFRGRDRLAILPRILEIPGFDLGPELGGEVRSLVEASRSGDSLEPGFETRVERVLARVVPALRAGLEEQRDALQPILAGWTRVLAPAERDPILERYWGTVEEPELPSVMAALRNLGDVRGALDRAREQTEGEIRSLLDGGGATAGDASAVEHARDALTSGDPQQLLAARRALTMIKSREEHGRTAQELEAAQSRLNNLCQRSRQVLESSDGALDGTARGILETNVSASEELVLASAEADSSDEVAAWTRSIATREASLGAMLDSVAASGPVWAEQQRAVAETVAQQMNHLAADDAEARQQAERSAAEEEIRAASRRLTAALEKSAAALPAERIVGARVLIEETDELIADGEPEAMRSLGGRIEKEAKELHQLAERAEEYLTSRETAERKRITNEAKKLEGLATGREAKKLGTLIAKAKGAGVGEFDALEAEIRSVTSKAGNRVRLEAAGLAKQAGKQIQRKSGKPAAAELEKTVAALQAARDDDDLASMAQSSAALKGQLPKFSGTTLYAGLGALAVVVLLGAFFVWQSFSEDTHPYQLTLMADEAIAGEATLMLVQEGNIFAQEPYRAGQPATFELPSGRYEVYVNGRFTGTVIQVPDDPPQVSGIPFPR